LSLLLNTCYRNDS